MTQAYFHLQNLELWSIHFLYNASLSLIIIKKKKKNHTKQQQQQQQQQHNATSLKSVFLMKKSKWLFTLTDSLASISHQITQWYFF
jgi:hypothetical protein